MSWWRHDREEAALKKELQFHVEQRVSDLRASGLSEEEARRRVKQEFGGMEQVSEECRDVRPTRWLERLAADCRYALRDIRKNPGPSVTIILTVTVCVAVNTAIFAVVDSLLLKPLPFYRADRLITMTNQYPRAGVGDQDDSAAGDYIDREGLPALQGHALCRLVSNPVDRGATPVQMTGLIATPSFFPLLGVTPQRGRLFIEQDAAIGKHFVVILTDGLWREMFGGSEVIGREVRIGGQPRTVIGVLPAEFRFLTPDVRYVLPLALSAEEWRTRHSNSYRYLARLRDGATVEQAQAQVDAVNARLLEGLPELKELLMNAGFHTPVAPLQPWLTRHVRTNLTLLWIGAVLVLVIGAVNIAGLSMARASTRAREMATRVALGATTTDIVRQCLIANVAPALLGGLIGLGAGLFTLDAFDHSILPTAAVIAASPTVFIYALATAVAAGMIAGSMSLLPLRGLDLARAIQNGSRGTTARGTRLRRVFIVAQVAMAFVLLHSAGILTATIRELWRVKPGFQIENVQTASTYLPPGSYSGEGDLRKAMERITQAVRQIPGVQLAGGGSHVPFGSDYDDNVIFAEDYVMKAGESAISPVRVYVSPGYLEALQVPLIEGRLFDERDRSDAMRAVIVDEHLAGRFWPGRNPVGRRMHYPTIGRKPSEFWTVVGVVRSIRLSDPAGAENAKGMYYMPWSQGASRRVNIVWRGRSDTVAAVRAEFARIAPGAALFDVRTMSERQAQTLAGRRLAQTLALTFAGVAVLLTAIGINGLLAFLVTQRRREIGIRIAIGSSPGAVYRQFLGEGFLMVGAGLMVGFGVATLARSWFANLLYGVAPIEPVVVAAVAVSIVVVAVLAISLPATRASRVDPVAVLGES